MEVYDGPRREAIVALLAAGDQGAAEELLRKGLMESIAPGTLRVGPHPKYGYPTIFYESDA